MRHRPPSHVPPSSSCRPSTSPPAHTSLPASPPPLSQLRVLLVALSSTGLALGYCAQSNLGAGELLRHGVSVRHVSLAFLAGPLSGLLIQPLVGYLSDLLGSRRPFLAVGAAGVAASLRLFARAGGVREAVVSFFALDISLQAVQAPVRALVTDAVPSAQRPLVNARLAICGALGQMVSGALAATAPKWKPAGYSDAAAAIDASAVVALACFLPCVVYTPRPPSPPATHAHSTQPPRLHLRDTPRPFWQTFAVQLCTWSGFFAMAVYASAWVGSSVFGGDGSAATGTPPRALFDAGVRYAASASAVGAAVSLVASVVLPRLPVALSTVYTASQALEAVSLCAPLYASSCAPLAFAALAAFGAVSAATNVLPWLVVADALQSDPRCAPRVGVLTTIFNISQSFPQLILGLVAPLVSGRPALVMPLAGAVAAAGGALVHTLRVDTLSDGRKITLNNAMGSAFTVAPHDVEKGVT